MFRALVMGCDPNAIKLREEEIVRFADLGEFIDLPIRTYSSGMLVQLAFAISSYLDGDILLIDEVFGAGDANFQIKAMARLNSLIEQAKIVILVGHTLETITHFCDRVLWVDRGGSSWMAIGTRWRKPISPQLINDGATIALIRAADAVTRLIKFYLQRALALPPHQTARKAVRLAASLFGNGWRRPGRRRSPPMFTWTSLARWRAASS